MITNLSFHFQDIFYLERDLLFYKRDQTLNINLDHFSPNLTDIRRYKKKTRLSPHCRRRFGKSQKIRCLRQKVYQIEIVPKKILKTVFLSRTVITNSSECHLVLKKIPIAFQWLISFLASEWTLSGLFGCYNHLFPYYPRTYF